MLKLLLKLWWTQKRRDFKWMRFFGEVYFFGLFLAISIIATVGAKENTDANTPATTFEMVATMIAVIFIIPDFINKLVTKHDVTVMDHYLKSRPIPERDWNRFLLVTNLFNFWNWAIPLCLLPFCLLFLPWAAMLPAFLLFFAVSMVNGVAITAFRRAKGWHAKWPVPVAVFMWSVMATIYALLVGVMPWGLHVAGFLALCASAVAMFYSYLSELRRYDESQARASRAPLLRASSLFALEYTSVFRSKRLRSAVLIIPFVFVLNVYLNTLNELTFVFYIWLMFVVFSPSMMLGQWFFGVEGNFFDGLWTKPVDIGQILRNKFWFCALLNAVALLLVVPVVWLAGISPWLLVATWLFVAGLCNLSLMPTALISSRIDLFQSAFFNYQGASMAINLYGMIILVPMAVFCLCAWMLQPLVASLVLGGLGILGFALYRVVIAWIVRTYIRRRYECFERYRN